MSCTSACSTTTSAEFRSVNDTMKSTSVEAKLNHSASTRAEINSFNGMASSAFNNSSLNLTGGDHNEYHYHIYANYEEIQRLTSQGKFFVSEVAASTSVSQSHATEPYDCRCDSATADSSRTTHICPHCSKEIIEATNKMPSQTSQKKGFSIDFNHLKSAFSFSPQNRVLLFFRHDFKSDPMNNIPVMRPSPPEDASQAQSQRLVEEIPVKAKPTGSETADGIENKKKKKKSFFNKFFH